LRSVPPSCDDPRMLEGAFSSDESGNNDASEHDSASEHSASDEESFSSSSEESQQQEHNEGDHESSDSDKGTREKRRWRREARDTLKQKKRPNESKENKGTKVALAYHKTSPGQPLEISLGMAGKPTYVGAAVAKEETGNVFKGVVARQSKASGWPNAEYYIQWEEDLVEEKVSHAEVLALTREARRIARHTGVWGKPVAK